MEKCCSEVQTEESFSAMLGVVSDMFAAWAGSYKDKNLVQTSFKPRFLAKKPGLDEVW